MTKRSSTYLKGISETGDIANQTLFEDLIDSMGVVDDGTTFDDSGTITVNGTKVYSTTRAVTASTHSLTIAASGHVSGNYIKVIYSFSQACTLTLNNFFTLGNDTGTINPIPAGTYIFRFICEDSRDGVFLSIPNNIQSTQDQLQAPPNFAVASGDTVNNITGISSSNATSYTLEYSTNQSTWINCNTLGTPYDGTSSTYIHTGLTNGVPIYYSVKASASGYIDSAYAYANGTPNSGYDADAIAIFNQMASVGSEPNTTRKDHINTLVTSLKSDGVWAELDSLIVCAAHGQNEALVDWISPTGNAATLTATPTFTTDDGFTFNGSTQGLLSGIIPSTDLTAGSLNDISQGIYIGNLFAAPATSATLFGGTMTAPSVSALKMSYNQTATYFQANINDATSLINGTQSRTTDSLYSMFRTASNARASYQNDTQISSDTQASIALPDVEMAVGYDNHETNGAQSFSNIKCKAYFIGSSSVSRANLKARLDNFFAAI